MSHRQPIVHPGVPLTRCRVADSPLHLLRLTDIGVDSDGYRRDIRPSFDALPWDTYDVTAAKLAYLHAQGDAVRREADRLSLVADEPERVAGVDAVLETLPADQRQRAEAILPFRRRAMRKYRLTHGGDDRWEVDVRDDRTFSQRVTDYRSRTRIFSLMDMNVACHPGTLTLLVSAAETVRRYHPTVSRIDAVLHQVMVVARPGVSGHPAPEGRHQDGVDYIVSAVVIERRNVTGGVSTICRGRDGTALLEVELAAGEGIFQADAGSPLWHEVTAVQAIGADDGHRMTLGIDLNIA